MEIFVTHSWIDEKPDIAVIMLVNELRKKGYQATVDIILRQEETAIDFNKMMAQTLKAADKVIVVLSEMYKEKADSFRGGVGDEFQYIIEDIKRNLQKYILVTFEHDREKVTPDFIRGRDVIFLDRNKIVSNELLHKINSSPEYEFSPVNPQKYIPERKKVSQMSGDIYNDSDSGFLKQDFNNKKQTTEENYILTPHAPRWKSRHILGRGNYVSDICKKLVQEKPKIQLSGMGGIGKTEILNRIYVYFADNKPEHDFEHIALINYDGNMDSNLVQQLEYTGEKTAENAWRFLHRLCDKKSVLLLIDDIRPKQEKKDISGFKDESFSKLFSLNAAVVFASRVKHSKFDNKKVDFLPTEVCTEIFQKQRYDEENKTIPELTEKDEAILKNIIENRAGNNTLAVNRLGVMIKQHGYSISQLEKSLAEMNFDISISDDDEYENEEKFQEQLDKLYNLKDITKSSEKNILEAFALFPAIALEREVCLKWLCEDSGLDEDECSLALNKLSERTWLIRHTDKCGTSYSMHQIVRASVLSQSTVKIENHTGLIKECGKAVTQERKDTFLKVQPYIPYAKALADYFGNEDSEEIAKLMYWIGWYCDDIASYEEAIKWYNKALAIREKVLGMEHPGIANTYNNIAAVYRVQGDYPKALEFYNKALAICVKVHGKEHQLTALAYNNIAMVYSRLGDYPEALEWLKKDLEISEKVLGSEHPDTATTYNNIALVYSMQGDYAKALECYEKALAVYENVLGNEHPLTALADNNIASVYDNQGDYSEALEWYKKALAIREKVFGAEHPDTATFYNNIAGVYRSQGDYTKALEWYNKALEIFEKVLGAEHPLTATTYNNIASVYSGQGDYPDALKWYQKALVIREKVLGSEHPDTATTYNNVACVFYSQEDYDTALDWFKKAYYICIKRLGSEHPNTKSIYNGMYTAYIKSGRNKDDFEEWLGIQSVDESQQQIAASSETLDNKDKPTIFNRVKNKIFKRKNK